MVGKRTFPLIRVGLPTGEILASLLTQYYDAGHEIPGEIILPEEVEGRSALSEWLGERLGRSVRILIPKRGQGRDLMEMANRNSESTLKIMQQTSGPDEAMKRLVTALGLRKTPDRMECFDISNLGGDYAVGSMVVFSSGIPAKDQYRRFRIRTVSGADDYAMMYEVLKRRYMRREALPDLLMVDGGKGQLSVALSVLKDMDIAGVEVIALAKGGDYTGEKPRGADRPDVKMGDRVFLPSRKDALDISPWPEALFLLQRLRDEAHRFAVSYYRKIKEKEDFSSLLERIPGVGPERRKTLLKGLGDIGRIREATVSDLQKIKGIGKDLAAAIYVFFRKENGLPS
jgi:excinuclease ABC subunit C